jgi:5-methylcytosine-specific restriction endonuclease McrA
MTTFAIAKCRGAPRDMAISSDGLTRRAWSRVPRRIKRQMLRDLCRQQQFRCAICRKPFEGEDLLNIDHRVPISKGGTNAWTNLGAAHVRCNDKKADTVVKKR